jgi:eukaryotic-like serine/threonine-protein kinase
MGPQVIAGRYRVDGAAGHGGMGTVWLCTDEVLGRQVAVKQVGTLPGQTSLDVARALREARSSAALNHRNVVSVYDAIEDGDQIWMVMEYVPGRTLSELLAVEGALPPEAVAHIGAQVAEGLAAAHARGTIHRDVKPGNILVTEDGTAKISDFGISRTVGDAQVTQTGMVMGTPLYFSPELARGADPTPAADVWALGATLFTAVEGHPLYSDQQNPLAVLSEIARSEPPRPEQAAFLTEPIVRSLDPDPGSRWSMADLAHVLDRLDRQHARANTRAFTASMPPVTPAPLVHEEHPRDDDHAEVRPPDPVPDPVPVAAAPTEERRRSGGRGLLVAGLVALLVLVAAGGFLLLRDLGDESTPDEAASPSATDPSPGGESEEGATDTSPSGSAEETPEPSETADGGGSPIAGEDAEEFLTSYYAALPDDTQAGWQSLSSQLRDSIGYDSYRGFWNTIADVSVTDTSPVSDGTVDVSLTYTHQDGRTEDEVRRIVVAEEGGGLRIAEDEAIG